MIRPISETPAATLRYALAPDEAGIQAIEATFDAYDRMMTILSDVAPVGANLVSLHAQAYEKIRTDTDLPARLVTLGLRDRASYVAGAVVRPVPGPFGLRWQRLRNSYRREIEINPTGGDDHASRRHPRPHGPAYRRHRQSDD
jgi:hypothetical protein